VGGHDVREALDPRSAGIAFASDGPGGELPGTTITVESSFVVGV
jgi:hypothetical protein